MSAVGVLRFLLACGKIKRTVRTGWTRFGVKDPESVADHMYRVALLSTLLPSTEDFKPESYDAFSGRWEWVDVIAATFALLVPSISVPKYESLFKELPIVDVQSNSPMYSSEMPPTERPLLRLRNCLFCKYRVMKMAVVHDLAECIVGDITPCCGVSREEKHAREAAAFDLICKELPEEMGKKLIGLWKEYEEQKTPESVICKDLDKFEMILQAYEYEVEADKPGWLEQFFRNTEGVFSYPCVRAWVDELRKTRTATAASSHSSSEEN